jgi:hypothetical protein
LGKRMLRPFITQKAGKLKGWVGNHIGASKYPLQPSEIDGPVGTGTRNVARNPLIYS